MHMPVCKEYFHFYGKSAVKILFIHGHGLMLRGTIFLCGLYYKMFMFVIVFTENILCYGIGQMQLSPLVSVSLIY